MSIPILSDLTSAGGIISEARRELAEVCATATGWVTHAMPPRSLSVPCIIVLHGSPMMEAVEDPTFRDATAGSYTINFEVFALVADNDSSTSELEAVIDDLIPVLLPTQVSEPLVISYATNNYLGIRFQVAQFAQYGN